METDYTRAVDEARDKARAGTDYTRPPGMADVEVLSAAEIEMFGQTTLGSIVEERMFATIRDRDADIARLHGALREQLVTIGNAAWYDEPEDVGGCDLCQEWWPGGDPENHAPGCLAAPRETAQ